ncbi:hypothetical protein [Natrinema sp. 1APR25-10V2]|uniref:hypothetical protein n=1 Tax=Natrinema sp. 1APR25-10V2 TaxID=2951081 RepID=UPI002874B843|nr:hypothetical protein [Natrinema sp. 1APR25-10V2]MDS0476802.1 hypothetical protein [Natrinema sp. 1APR25-10V2]
MAGTDPQRDRGRVDDRDRSVAGTVTFATGEPGRYARLHRGVFFFIGVFTGGLGLIFLFASGGGSLTREAVAFLGLVGSTVVSWYGVGQGYAVAAVPGVVAAVLSLVLGIWMVMLAVVELGAVFVVMGVTAAMTSVAAWMELLANPEAEDGAAVP